MIKYRSNIANEFARRMYTLQLKNIDGKIQRKIPAKVARGTGAGTWRDIPCNIAFCRASV